MLRRRSFLPTQFPGAPTQFPDAPTQFLWCTDAVSYRRGFVWCADTVSMVRRRSFPPTQFLMARRHSFIVRRHGFHGAPTQFPTDAVSCGAPTQFCSAPTQLLMVVKPWRWSCFGGSRPCFGGSLVTSELLVDNMTYHEPLDHPLHHGADRDGG